MNNRHDERHEAVHEAADRTVSNVEISLNKKCSQTRLMSCYHNLQEDGCCNPSLSRIEDSARRQIRGKLEAARSAKLDCDELLRESVPESVIGIDDRVQIASTESAPWRMVCQLEIEGRDGSFSLGTGWLISPRTVITAGHCVYRHGKTSGWPKSVQVIPGMNGDSKPFESGTGTKFMTVRGWKERRMRTHDYGCILLPQEAPIGLMTGWLGFASLSDRSLRDIVVHNCGYPADKPYGTQWFDTGRLMAASSKQLRYELDTAGGQSGSPLWRAYADECHVVGIHAYGGDRNKSTRINSAVFNNLLEWKRLGL